MSRRLYILLYIGVVLFSPQIARGQNNFYAIDDDCYRIMLTLSLTTDSESEYMNKCDAMYGMAMKKHDAKAMTLAVSNKLTFYDDHHMLDKLRMQAEKLRQEAMRTGYMQYYYFAYNREIEALLYIDMEEAMRIAKQMTREADEDEVMYGKFMSYQQLGNVYKARHNKELSRQNYYEALELAPKLSTQQRTSAIYISLSELTDDYMQKTNLLGKAMDAAMESGDSLRVYQAQCKAYGKYDMRNQFFAAYKHLAELFERVELGYDYEPTVLAYKAAFEGNYDEAYKMLDKETSPESAVEKLNIGIDIATREGDYKHALQYALDLEEHNDRVFMSHRGFEFAELTDLIENERLSSQQAEQAMQQVRLQLESENMITELRELEALNEALKIRDQQMESSNMLAATKNRQYEDSLRYEQGKRELMQTEAIKQLQSNTRNMFVVIAVSLIAVIAIILVFVFSYRKTSKSLLRHAKVLRAARLDALDAAEMKNVFLQNMSHEMRTPLNAVMGFSQLMAVPGLPLSEEEKMEYSEHILNNSKMLTMLVDDILNIADIEKGNYSIVPSTCSANEIMADAVSTAEYRAQDGVRVYYTSDVADDFLIVADGRRVQQVLINFLTNACKHTEQGEIHLHLAISEDSSQLEYSVTDTGCGIPKDKAEKIFERFTKLNDFKQGTGLGLNICRLIAKKMQGRVYCDTRYTSGARFVFEVPLVRA